MKIVKKTALIILLSLHVLNLSAQFFDNLAVNSSDLNKSPLYAEKKMQDANSLSPFTDLPISEPFSANTPFGTRSQSDPGGRPGLDDGIGQVGDVSIGSGICFLLIATTLYSVFIYFYKSKKSK